MLGSKSAASAGFGGGGSPVYPARAAAAPPLGAGRRLGPGGGGGLRPGRLGRCYGSATGVDLEQSASRPARGQREPRALRGQRITRREPAEDTPVHLERAHFLSAGSRGTTLQVSKARGATSQLPASDPRLRFLRLERTIHPPLSRTTQKT